MTEEIDEGLFSRQLITLGVEAMKKMAKTSVLISGMGGLGIEIAKNVVLMGIRYVTIHDTKSTTIDDIASQFYLTEADIGKNRAEASLSKLAELNQHVSVSVSTCELTEEYIKKFNAVVLTDYVAFSELLRISDICHANDIKFIASQVSGLFGYVFDDFGKDFVVIDPRGEIPSRFLIEYISHSENSVITVADGGMHNLNDGDHVYFEEVAGMTELNGKEFPVKVINANKFSIGDTTQFGEYELKGSGGYGNQVVLPVTLNFTSLRDNLYNHTLKVTDVDFVNFGRDRQNFLAFITASRYREEFPSDSQIDSQKFVELAQKVNAEFQIADGVDEDLMRVFVREEGVVITPMCAVFGGIIGQEVIKAVSGKYTPFDQAFTLCYTDSTTDDAVFEAKGDRYDPYRRIFGNELQEKMMNLRYFLIGAGAIGCEMLKNWAMMGLFTGPQGHLTLTDMDTIEKSNLSRQFLFRDRDIGQSKSRTATRAVQQMNPAMKIEPQEHKLAPETRDIYSDEFYFSIDGVCNALDNITARLFSDKLCVYYGKPLLESGTLGPKANYQIVVPNLSESYGSSQDPEETAIPQCTLHNFPSTIDHCCEWARDVFGGYFEQPSVSFNKFVDGPQQFIDELAKQGAKQLYDGLLQVEECAENRPKTYADCVNYARRLFDTNFTWRIEDLLRLYPPGKLTEAGIPFWSGTKREPVVITFDPENELHIAFIEAAAKIHARIYGITPSGDITSLARSSSPGSRPVSVDDQTAVDFNDTKLKALQEKVLSLSGLSKLGTETFEKDDDSNSHIDFIAAAANLRATNYRIQTQSRLEIKRIAGKIIPAIATTTAMVCGFVALEMYKVHSIRPRKLSEYRNGFANLAIALFAFQEPLEAPVTKLPNGIQYTIWDKFFLKGDLTIQEVIDEIAEKFKLKVGGLVYGSRQLYSAIFSKMKKQQRLKMKVLDVIREVTKEELPKNQRWFELDAACSINGNYLDESPQFILDISK